MKKKIIIEGANSSHCITHVNDILKNVYGVKNVWINLDEKNVIVKLDCNIEDNKLSNTVNQIGYKAIKVITI